MTKLSVAYKIWMPCKNKLWGSKLRKPWRDMGIKKQKAKVDRYNKLCNSFPPISNSIPWFTYLVSQIAICSFNLHNSFTRITTPLFSIAWIFPSHWRIFHSYVDITIKGDGLKILTYARHLWPLSINATVGVAR